MPDYVAAFDEPINWLDFGVDSRSRFEFRDRDYRTADLICESGFFQRSLMYLGVHDLLDPFRFAAEFEDSRRSLSERAETANEANTRRCFKPTESCASTMSSAGSR